MPYIEEEEYEEEIGWLRFRVKSLEDGIRLVVTQRADGLCWRDAYEQLAQLVGMEFHPELICDQDKFLANCKAFDDSLRTGGKYKPVYVERQ